MPDKSYLAERGIMSTRLEQYMQDLRDENNTLAKQFHARLEMRQLEESSARGPHIVVSPPTNAPKENRARLGMAVWSCQELLLNVLRKPHSRDDYCSWLEQVDIEIVLGSEERNPFGSHALARVLVRSLNTLKKPGRFETDPVATAYLLGGGQGPVLIQIDRQPFYIVYDV